MSIFNPSGKQYLRCTKRLDNKSCPGCGKIITSELEAVVYQQMVKKLASYKTLTGRKKAAKANPKIAALQVELLHVDSEIEKLVDSLTGANNVLLSYVNVKIAELDGRKQELLARIAELTVEAISPEQVSQISGYLDTWDNVSFDDKRRVVDLMITTVAATRDVYKRQLYFRPRCGFGFFSKSDLSVLRNGWEAILGLSRLDCPSAKTGRTVNGGA